MKEKFDFETGSDFDKAKFYLRKNGGIILAVFLTLFNCLNIMTINFEEATQKRAEAKAKQAEFDAKFVTQAEYQKLKNPKPIVLTPLEEQKMYWDDLETKKQDSFREHTMAGL